MFSLVSVIELNFQNLNEGDSIQLILSQNSLF